MSETCPQCRSALKPNARFCGKCGAKIDTPSQGVAQSLEQTAERNDTAQSSRQTVTAPTLPTPTVTAPTTATGSMKPRSLWPLLIVIGIVIGIVIIVSVSASQTKNLPATPPTPIPLKGTYVHQNGGDKKAFTFYADGHAVYSTSASATTEAFWYRRDRDYPALLALSSTQAIASGSWVSNYGISADESVITNVSSGAKYLRQ